MNFEKGINRIILFLSGLIGCCFFLTHIDYILSWDRTGGIIPFPGFFILMFYSLLLSLFVFIVSRTFKFFCKWIADGFNS